jgi:hypothetical protein
MSSITAANKKEKILAILKDVETKGEVKSSIVEGLKQPPQESQGHLSAVRLEDRLSLSV